MIRILICDDEPSYQKILENKIKKLMSDEIHAECDVTLCNTIDNLSEIINTNQYDIVFLDVLVNDVNSIDWIISNRITDNYPAKFIIMTGFPMESYKISDTKCCYYLIKPKLTNEQLKKAVLKAINEITKKSVNKKLIKVGSKNYTINLQDVLYIEAFNNNIMLHFTNEPPISIYSTLKKFSASLTPNFLRCHKSYTVNMNHIKGYKPHSFVLSDNSIVPIPPKKYTQTIESYKNYILIL